MSSQDILGGWFSHGAETERYRQLLAEIRSHGDPQVAALVHILRAQQDLDMGLRSALLSPRQGVPLGCLPSAWQRLPSGAMVDGSSSILPALNDQYEVLLLGHQRVDPSLIINRGYSTSMPSVEYVEALLGLQQQQALLPSEQVLDHHNDSTFRSPTSEARPPSVEHPDNKRQSLTSRTNGPEPFPEKVFRLLLDCEVNHSEDIASFTPSGKAFWVHDRDRFVKEIVPKYFRQSKWESFIRQLNIYRFERIVAGSESGAFGHPCFRKDCSQLLVHIPRQE